MHDDKPATPAPQGRPVPEPSALDAGAETLISEHAARFSGGPRRGGFMTNLIALMLLAALATWWFQEHLQPYFTGIVLVGGSLTLWALLRLLWGVYEKVTKVDVWDRSRKLLSGAEATRLLLVAAAALALLWVSTASIYFDHGGKGSGEAEYRVQVLRSEELTPFIDAVTVSPTTPLAGRPFFWLGAKVALTCRIVQPAGFEPLDCSIASPHSTRVHVPGSFRARELHLLRLVPSGLAYIELPQVGDLGAQRYRLVLEVAGQRHELDDVRKQTIYLGAAGDDMALASALETPAEYPAFLSRSLRAAQVDPVNAEQMAAVLASNTREWKVLNAKAGQTLKLELRYAPSGGGAGESGVVAGFPISYTITSERVQTIWLPRH